jgi:hypothetical protein
MESTLSLLPNRDALRLILSLLLFMRCTVQYGAAQIDLQGRRRALQLVLLHPKLVANFVSA